MTLAVVLAGGWCQAFAAPPFYDQLTTFRSAQSLSIPAEDPGLTRSAAARAQVLATGGFLSHSDRDGRGPGLQMTAEGYAPGEFGEVLGAGADPGSVWAAWIASPSHRAVLETPGWKTWGSGVVSLGKTRVWVIRFWKP